MSNLARKLYYMLNYAEVSQKNASNQNFIESLNINEDSFRKDSENIYKLEFLNPITHKADVIFVDGFELKKLRKNIKANEFSIISLSFLQEYENSIYIVFLSIDNANQVRSAYKSAFFLRYTNSIIPII